MPRSPLVPATPAEAEKKLRAFVKQIQKHLRENKYKTHETFVSADLLLWFVAAARICLRDRISLDQSLGLKRKRGRPKPTTPGKHYAVARKAFKLLLLKKPWTAICHELGFDPSELSGIVQRERPRIVKELAAEVAERAALRSAKHASEKRARERASIVGLNKRNQSPAVSSGEGAIVRARSCKCI